MDFVTLRPLWLLLAPLRLVIAAPLRWQGKAHLSSRGSGPVNWPIANCYLSVAACLCGICQPLPMPGTGACSKMLFAFGREHVVVHAYHHGDKYDRVVEKM